MFCFIQEIGQYPLGLPAGIEGGEGHPYFNYAQANVNYPQYQQALIFAQPGPERVIGPCQAWMVVHVLISAAHYGFLIQQILEFGKYFAITLVLSGVLWACYTFYVVHCFALEIWVYENAHGGENVGGMMPPAPPQQSAYYQPAQPNVNYSNVKVVTHPRQSAQQQHSQQFKKPERILGACQLWMIVHVIINAVNFAFSMQQMLSHDNFGPATLVLSGVLWACYTFYVVHCFALEIWLYENAHGGENLGGMMPPPPQQSAYYQPAQPNVNYSQANVVSHAQQSAQKQYSQHYQKPELLCLITCLVLILDATRPNTPPFLRTAEKKDIYAYRAGMGAASAVVLVFSVLLFVGAHELLCLITCLVLILDATRPNTPPFLRTAEKKDIYAYRAGMGAASAVVLVFSVLLFVGAHERDMASCRLWFVVRIFLDVVFVVFAVQQIVESRNYPQAVYILVLRIPLSLYYLYVVQCFMLEIWLYENARKMSGEMTPAYQSPNVNYSSAKVINKEQSARKKSQQPEVCFMLEIWLYENARKISGGITPACQPPNANYSSAKVINQQEQSARRKSQKPEVEKATGTPASAAVMPSSQIALLFVRGQCFMLEIWLYENARKMSGERTPAYQSPNANYSSSKVINHQQQSARRKSQKLEVEKGTGTPPSAAVMPSSQ
ncbi:hypothetical protein Fcan01_27302 [Folsomia candida]|uniref:Uncharacterized protein n=1 Tax=Folsomia candida TaxID=158441 RepID=A0A226CYR7_FOLCA|nr:hypothetical protein Fcan01_27302 [Folsomia candida]